MNRGLSENSMSYLNEKEIQYSIQDSRIKVLRNTFVLLIVMESITILTQIFALSYYAWYYDRDEDIWLQLIYAYTPTTHYISFKGLCNLSEFEDLCAETAFIIYRTQGMVVFIIMVFIIFIIVGDLIRITKQLYHLEEEMEVLIFCVKGKCLHLVSFFGLIIIYLYSLIQAIILDFLQFAGIGPALYTGLAGAILYLVTIIYYRLTKARLERVSYMDKLLRSSINQEFEIKKRDSSERFQSCLMLYQDQEFQSIN